MAAFQLAHPSNFHFSKPEEWLKWIRRFQCSRVPSGLADKDEENQVRMLIYSMGDQQRIFSQSWTSWMMKLIHKTQLSPSLSHTSLQSGMMSLSCQVQSANARGQCACEFIYHRSRSLQSRRTLWLWCLTRWAHLWQNRRWDQQCKTVWEAADGCWIEPMKNIDQARPSESVKKQQPLLKNNFQEEKTDANTDAIHAC